MELSAIAFTSPRSPFTKHKPVLPAKPTSSLSTFSCFSTLSRDKEPVLSSNSDYTRENCLFGVGIGLLAASVLAFSPMDADATRIEYYATVADPLCDFNFVRSGLGYCDISVGSGQEAPYGELVDVIRGLDQGILGGDGVPPMQVGGKRKLQIPPKLAYGPEPAGCFSGDCNIPANATLVYDINLVRIYSGNRK
ncbi:photosynthetic NDH subunit of lumenal location 4, chloroplastic isoform X2 [Hevea brasiliensis]|uniref:photosynthetic NDH subunit of lumenal location 4, chloroplastic isoform X2 n=1 Tax=Hevea brasiliensis TaxID=3981 RepID=UPI0025F637B4|nr:photosynthetic NDH subunit of lumenal location 4, chloroplastic isoform X2 [Hevea brasiliensis]